MYCYAGKYDLCRITSAATYKNTWTGMNVEDEK